MAIKGQNLRIFIDSKVVAAATSCTLHVATQTESITTKDTPNDFEEVAPVGLTWDASCEAVVSDGHRLSGSGVQCSIDTGLATLKKAHSDAIVLHAGETINLTGSAGTTNIGLVTLSGSTYTSVGYSAGSYDYTNSGTTDKTVYIAAANATVSISYSVADNNRNYLPALMLAHKNKDLVDVEFNSTYGTNNRAIDFSLYAGTAYITDISVTANNRAVGTYSVTLTGVGELEIVT